MAHAMTRPLTDPVVYDPRTPQRTALQVIAGVPIRALFNRNEHAPDDVRSSLRGRQTRHYLDHKILDSLGFQGHMRPPKARCRKRPTIGDVLPVSSLRDPIPTAFRLRRVPSTRFRPVIESICDRRKHLRPHADSPHAARAMRRSMSTRQAIVKLGTGLVDDGRGPDDLLRLVIEVKVYCREDGKVKAATTKTYWIPSVNHLRTYRRWAFRELRDVYEMETDFDAAIRAAFDETIESVVNG